MVGIVEAVGAAVTHVKPVVNNCTDPNGGWALGCRIDGGQAEYVRVPYADQGLTVIPDRVSDRQALKTQRHCNGGRAV